MKKWFSLVMLGTTVVFLSLAYGARPAFAATLNVTSYRVPATLVLRAAPSRWLPRGWQVQNQYYHGNAYSNNHLTFRGHNESNSGNQGDNRGYNQNFSGNAGNILHNKRWSHFHRHTRQYSSGNSYSQNWVTTIGHNQYNSGNQGDNEEVSEDHSGNSGNQIVN